MKNNLIIVEGKTDKSKIQSIFPDVKIVLTNGFNFNNDFLKYLKKLSETNEIIIFTDPDWAGQKIRNKIGDFLDNKCKHAYIDKSIIKNDKKQGIAEASKEQIKQALNNLISFNKNNCSLTWEEYLDNNFFLKENRVKICKYINWNQKINAKSLFKLLNSLNLSVANLKKIVKES